MTIACTHVWVPCPANDRPDHRKHRICFWCDISEEPRG